MAITVAPSENAAGILVVPMALLRPDGATSDSGHDEEPDLVEQIVGLRLAVAIPGDAIGENALIGANRVGQTDSRGRGLLEIEEEVFAAIERLNDIDGVRIQSRAKSAATAVLHERIGYIGMRDYSFEAICTADRFYHPGSKLTATALGGGSVSLTWVLPPDRYDRLRVKLRRAAGSTPPATPSAGTGVTLSGDFATSVTDAPGVGTFSYSLFGMYDESGADPLATEERNSDPVSKTVVAT